MPHRSLGCRPGAVCADLGHMGGSLRAKCFPKPDLGWIGSQRV
jgi:hypothetical protein